MTDAPTIISSDDALPDVQEPRFWRENGWTSKVVKNDDGDGWAVETYKDGNSDPALVGPWTMGRNKVDPKPLDATAHQTLIKTASEVLRRHEQQLHAQLNKQVEIEAGGEPVTVRLAITPDEYEPFGTLTALDASGDEIGTAKVPASFKLTRDSARSWATSGYRQPG